MFLVTTTLYGAPPWQNTTKILIALERYLPVCAPRKTETGCKMWRLLWKKKRKQFMVPLVVNSSIKDEELKKRHIMLCCCYNVVSISSSSFYRW
jgi:hypothetical protein